MNTLNTNMEINDILTNFSTIMNSNILILKKQKKALLQYVQKIFDYPSDTSSAIFASQLIEFLTILKEKNNQIDECISNANNYINELNVIKTSKHIENPAMLFKNFVEYSNNISNCIIELEDFFIYSIHCTKINFEKTYSNESKTFSVNKNIENNFELNNINQTPIIQNSQNSCISGINLLENTLIISETQGKVFLPYTLDNLKTILYENKSKYENIKEVIEDNFTIPYSYFKNLSFSRFKEAFSLIKNKEHGSIKEAFDLGMELLFNYNLHPAIISACKSIDELDIYLDYLQNNETDKFSCFNIKFEIAPSIRKK